MNPAKFFRSLCAVFLVLLLAGCRQELYAGLQEDEANQMLAVLLENGIAAQKEAQGKKGYTILTPEKEVVRSLKLLNAKSLPRASFRNMGEVFSGQGMVASPTEEQARFAFALSQELAETFSKIDGVLTSRAHVVLAQHDAGSGVDTPASAAVFLRHAPDSPVADLQAKIKETCAQAVPGLRYDQVSVMLVPVREDVVLPARRVRPDEDLLYAGALLLVVVLAGGGALLARRGKKTPENKEGDA
jgi:type III secretion protein J